MSRPFSEVRRNAPKVWGDTPRHVINVDWDGTVVPAMWPERPTTLLPGAKDALTRFHNAGHPVRIWTARINPMDPWTGERRPAEAVEEEIRYIRITLDYNGLEFVEIYTAEGKPGGAVYIDDKAERYNPGAKSWARLADKILLRLDGEEPIFPHVANGTEASV
jgi:hypothetical protein